MRVNRYVERVYDLFLSKGEIRIEEFRFAFSSTGQIGTLETTVRFWDGSMLFASETLEAKGLSFVKTDYAYHFQDSENNLIFRYDNAAHHPNISTHPHHKHTPGNVGPATPPNLWEVLQEAEAHLYPE